MRRFRLLSARKHPNVVLSVRFGSGLRAIAGKARRFRMRPAPPDHDLSKSRTAMVGLWRHFTYIKWVLRLVQKANCVLLELKPLHDPRLRCMAFLSSQAPSVFLSFSLLLASAVPQASHREAPAVFSCFRRPLRKSFDVLQACR